MIGFVNVRHDFFFNIINRKGTCLIGKEHLSCQIIENTVSYFFYIRSYFERKKNNSTCEQGHEGRKRLGFLSFKLV